MKQVFFNLLLGSFVLLMAISSCKTEKQDTNKIEWDTIQMVQNFPLHHEVDTPALKVDITYIYPNNNNKLLEVMNRIVFADSTKGEAANKVVDNFAEALGKEYRVNNVATPIDGVLPEILFNHFYETCNTITYKDANIISGEVKKVSYEGGAHPENHLVLFNIDLNSYKTITESDIFIDGYKELLPQIIINKLLTDYKKSSPEELDVEGFFNVDDLVPNDNFSINSEGITYCFNEYQIASYAQGAIYVFLPYDVLLPVLKPESVVGKFLN